MADLETGSPFGGVDSVLPEGILGFDKQRVGLYEFLAQTARGSMLTDSAAAEIGMRAEAVKANFGKALDTLSAAGDQEPVLESMATLWYEDENDRSQRFANMLKRDWPMLPPRQITDCIADATSEKADVASRNKAIALIFGMYLEVDLYSYREVLREPRKPVTAADISGAVIGTVASEFDVLTSRVAAVIKRRLFKHLPNV
jgi:hypothetical protein